MRRILATIAVLLAPALLFVAPKTAFACSCFDSAGTKAAYSGTAAECSAVCGTTTATVQTSPPDTCACGGTVGTKELNCTTVCADNKVSFTDPTAASNTVTPLVGYAVPQLNVKIPGVNFETPIDTGGVATSDFIGVYIAGAYKYLIGFAMTIAIVMIMVGGLQYVLGAASGDVKKGKERINKAIEGFVLLMFVYVILYTVNPNMIFLRPLSLGTLARAALDLQINSNLKDCPAVKGTVKACSVQVFKDPGGWGALATAINTAHDSTGVDPILVAAHIEQESGGGQTSLNWGSKLGLCGGLGPTQFSSTTALNPGFGAPPDCCANIARKSGINDKDRGLCKATTETTSWPPPASAGFYQCTDLCGHCEIPSASCVAWFTTPGNIQNVVNATSKLIINNLAHKSVGGDLASEMCAYNGSGSQAAAYAQSVGTRYAKFCKSSGGTQ